MAFDEDTYGDYILTILDQDGTIVYENEGHISFDDTNVTVTLDKGKYILELKENDDYEFEYGFSLKYKPIGEVATKSLKLSKTSLTLSKGGSTTIKATYSPSYSTDTILWESSNTKVATVNKSGKVTAKGIGKTTITAKMGSKTKKCTVIVNKAQYELDKGSKSLLNGMKNVSGYNKAVWNSSNTKVATVSKTGTIKALAHGKTSITASVNGEKYKFTIYVYDHDILVNQAKSTLKDLLKNPNSLIINKITGNGNFVSIDYSAMNGFGGYNRENFYAYYKDGKLQYISY